MKSANEEASLVATSGLSAIDREFVHFFVQMATSLSLPRSVGEIFGFLFASKGPQSFDDVVSGLGISKGSASQGLRFLMKIGAISLAYVPGDRRTFYEAETSMRKVFSEALRESVRPHLESNRETIDQIESVVALHDFETEELERHYELRLASLQNWNEKALQLLPLLTTLFNLKIPATLLKAGREGDPLLTEDSDEPPARR